jgi:hypothetical protein
MERIHHNFDVSMKRHRRCMKNIAKADSPKSGGTATREAEASHH